MMKNCFISILLALATLTAAAQTEPADTTGVAGAAAEAVAGAERGATDQELWDRANAAYVDGDFRTAIDRYAELLGRGRVSARLFYNMGNACFKEERTGEAILYYRRALRLAPGNEDIRYNLSVAEARTKDNIERIPEFFLTTWLRAVRHTMGCTAWTVLSLVLLAAALGLVLLYLLAQRLALRKAGFYGTLAAGVLFLGATLMAAGERREMLDRTQAVVMSSSVAVKSSPDRSSTDLFVLHEGTVATITDRLEEWCEITIADGKKGWVELRALEIV